MEAVGPDPDNCIGHSFAIGIIHGSIHREGFARAGYDADENETVEKTNPEGNSEKSDTFWPM